VYAFGRYDVNLLAHVVIADGAFVVQGQRVEDESCLAKALEIAGSSYVHRARLEADVSLKKKSRS